VQPASRETSVNSYPGSGQIGLTTWEPTPSIAKREEYRRAPRYNGYIISTIPHGSRPPARWEARITSPRWEHYAVVTRAA
jgi:hypothetical protein